MYSVWQSLLWKEWREHRVVLAVLTAILIGAPVLFSLRTPTNYFGIFSLCLIATPVVGMFLAMHIAAGEQSTGTIGFLQALPITGRKPAAVKLFWAIAAVVIPVTLAVGAAILWSWMLGEAADHPIAEDESLYGTAPGTWFAARLFMPIVGSASLILWIAAAGVNRSDEVRAGAIGFLVAASYWLVLYLTALALAWLNIPEPPRLFALLFATAPGGVNMINKGMTFAPEGSSLVALYWPWAVVGLTAHVVLAAWYIGRFGRVTLGQVQAIEHKQAVVADRNWLAPPMRSPLAAIVWKQVRESGPLAVMGACCVAAIAIIVRASLLVGERSMDGAIRPVDLFGGMFAIWLMVGFMVAIVAGIGVFLDDLKPGLYSFWRSRPLSVNQWFAVKFVAGLVVTVATLAIPVLAVGAYVLVAHQDAAKHEMVSIKDIAQGLGVGLLTQTGFYCLALTTMILLRRPIHAAVASIAIAVLAMIPIAIAANIIGKERLGVDQDTFVLAVGIPTLIAILTAIGWLSLRKNWGWKA